MSTLVIQAKQASGPLARQASGPLAEHARGPVIWLTGLSWAGKTTLGEALREDLRGRGVMACVLDGDEIRRGVSADLGFSPEDRTENNRRVAEIARLMSGVGITVIVALISPLQSDRDKARQTIEGAGGAFFEVFVNTPLAVCEERDVKGFYKRARLRQIEDFTGIQAPYEEPRTPDIVVRPAKETVETSVATVMGAVVARIGPAKMEKIG